MSVAPLLLLCSLAPASRQQAWPGHPPAFSGYLLGIENADLVVSVDLDGDGDLDLVTLGGYGQALRVHLGDGDGAFVADALPALPVLPGMTPRGAVAADFDGDGDPDVAVIGDVGLEGRLFTWLNDGTGALAPHTSQSFQKQGEFLSVSDVDGDGWTDLLMMRKAGPGLQLLRSLGPVGFAAPQWIDPPVGWAVARDYAVGDVDGDGRDDLLTLNWGSLSTPPIAFLYANDSLGGFHAPLPVFDLGEDVRRVLLADLRGDGVLHAVTMDVPSAQQSSLQWYENDGAGAFAPREVLDDVAFPPDGPRDLGVRDLDGDGREEIVAELPSGTFARLALQGSVLSMAEGELVTPSGRWLAAGDFDSDGAEDLLTAIGSPFGNSELSLSLDGGEGSLAGTVVSVLAPGATSAALLELNGDADLDLVVRAQLLHELQVYAGLGDGRFEWVQTLPTRDRPLDVAAGDFDGDGRTDLGVIEGFDVIVEVFLAGADGTFSSAGSTTPSQDPGSFGAGPAVVLDSDADGRDELAYVDAIGERLVFVGLGSTSSPEILAELDWPGAGLHGVTTPLPGVPQALELLAPGTNSYLSLWVLANPLGGQAATLIERLPLPIPPLPAGMFWGGLPQVSDPDEDGLIEVWATYAHFLSLPASLTIVWPSQLSGGFAPPLALRSPNPLWQLWAGDVDGDGVVDRAYKTSKKWTMQGFPFFDRLLIHRPALGGTLARSETYPWSQHAHGDVNGDGYTDMVVIQSDRIVSLLAAPKR